MSVALTRAAATRLLAERLTGEVVVSNLGQASLDLQQIADRPLNCYTYGAMGQCSSIALGIALARPDVRVVCLDGDGSLLMNLGSLCTIANEAPRNYALVVWDNEVHCHRLPVLGVHGGPRDPRDHRAGQREPGFPAGARV